MFDRSDLQCLSKAMRCAVHAKLRQERTRAGVLHSCVTERGKAAYCHKYKP